MSSVKRPNSRVNLDKAIERAFGRGDAALRARVILADVIVAQMLPEGVVKGGSSLKIRYGNSATRFTRDLDVARRGELDAFLDELDERLTDGWEGFTGRIVTRTPAMPAGVPMRYVMRPFDIKLSYNGKPWATVRLEVGHNEIGDADSADTTMSPDIVEMFRAIGLPDPEPVALMKPPHQIAQKIHGLTEPGSKRAHDLIDLQVIAQEERLDLSLVRQTCERLFAYRGLHEWPPLLEGSEGWAELYAAQKPPATVAENLDDAIARCDEFITAIARSQ